jgi:hypothetical protein
MSRVKTNVTTTIAKRRNLTLRRHFESVWRHRQGFHRSTTRFQAWNHFVGFSKGTPLSSWVMGRAKRPAVNRVQLMD